MGRIGVLASGSGTILQALLDADLPIVVAIADRPCTALERAARAGVATELVERESFGTDFDRLAFTHRVVDALKRHEVDVVAMAGFMTVLERPIFAAYHDRITNTHPSLLPEFKGSQAVADALAAGVERTGCTVHLATIEVDAGPILAQQAVPVVAGDTVESLHERIKEAERRLYPAVLRELVEQ